MHLSENIIFKYIQQNNIEKVEEFLNNNSTSVIDSIRNNNGEPALIVAVERGHYDIVKLLIEKGANIDIQSKYEQTALIIAARRGTIEIFKYLIEKGANIEIKNTYDETALFGAVSRDDENDEEIVKILLEKGSNPNEKNGSGRTALMSSNKKFKIIKLLLEYGADPNIKNEYGETVLFLVARRVVHEYTGIILLLEHGADPNIKNNNGETVFDVTRNVELRTILRKFMNVNVNAKIKEKITDKNVISEKCGNFEDVMNQQKFIDLPEVYVFEKNDKFLCFSYEDLHQIDIYVKDFGYDKEKLKEKFVRSFKNALLLNEEDFEEISQIISFKEDNKKDDSCEIDQSRIRDETYFDESLRCLRKESESFEYQDFILFLSNEIQRYKFTKERAMFFVRDIENSGVYLNLHDYDNLSLKSIQTYLISKIAFYLKNSTNKEVALSVINSVMVNLTDLE